jgi:hypothetical protein
MSEALALAANLNIPLSLGARDGGHLQMLDVAKTAIHAVVPGARSQSRSAFMPPSMILSAGLP